MFLVANSCGLIGGQSTKDLKDHLKTTHSQPDFFRPCLLKSQPGLVNKGFDEIAHLIIHYQELLSINNDKSI